ncbi:MAG: DUF2232 domain-containing protein [Anaerococcus vaginalis]|nr:DUF2232 domain-containing protein [Anaerococcus vaginalis]
MVDFKKNNSIKAIGYGLINLGLVFLSTYYLIFELFIPIFTAIKLWELDDKNKGIFLFTSGLLLIFINRTLTYFMMFPMIVLGIEIFYLIKINKTDKDAIKILSIIFSVLSLAIIGYLYTRSGIKLNDLVNHLYKIFEENNFKFDKEIIRKSLKTMPSVIILFSLVYSMISLKLVRNYLNYKDESMRDLKNIKGLRIELKDLIVIFGFLAISILLSKFFSLSNEFIILNSIMSLKFIFGINGILILVYLVSSKRSGISKIINWILIFLLFTYTSEIIAIIGFIDVFVNFRKKVRIG